MVKKSWIGGGIVVIEEGRSIFRRVVIADHSVDLALGLPFTSLGTNFLETACDGDLHDRRRRSYALIFRLPRFTG